MAVLTSTTMGQSGQSFFYFYRRNEPTVINSQTFGEQPSAAISYRSSQPGEYYDPFSESEALENVSPQNSFVLPTPIVPTRQPVFHRFVGPAPTYRRLSPIIPIPQRQPVYYGNTQLHRHIQHPTFAAPVRRRKFISQ